MAFTPIAETPISQNVLIPYITSAHNYPPRPPSSPYNDPPESNVLAATIAAMATRIIDERNRV